MMRSATGDIRWSYLYTRVIDQLSNLGDDAEPISMEFATAVRQMVKAGIGLAQFQASVVELLRSNELAAAKAAVGGTEFKTLRDTFQKELEGLGGAIENLSASADQAFERRLYWTGAGAVPVLAFAIIVAVICFRRLREWRDALNGTVRELHRHEAELEDRVAARTKALDHAEQMMRAAVDNMPGGIMMLDKDLNIVFLNERYRELYDVPEEIMQPGRPIRDILVYNVGRGTLGAGDSEAMIEARYKEFESGTPGNSEHCVDGERWLNVRHEPRPGGGVVLVATDITERKQADANLARTLTGLNAVLDGIDYGVLFMDSDLRTVISNKAFRDIWGIPEDFPTDRPTMADFIYFNRHNGIYDVADEDFDAFVEQRCAAVKAGAIPPTEVVRADGRVLIYQNVPLQDGDMMLTYFDITERKHAEDEAARQAAIIAATLENMEHGITMFDDDLTLVAYNSKFVDLLELPKDLIHRGTTMEELFRYNAERGEYGDNGLEEQIQSRLDLARKFEPHKFERTRPDGVILEVRGNPAIGGGFVSTYVDITETKNAAKVIEDAHAVMRDSIQYASRIQRSLLPNDHDMRAMFADHFCIWEPRDVVGGDMYWVREDRRGYFVALFDCTGHGVPGALMTTITVSALDVAFSETGDPSRLITRVNQIIKKALGQDSDDGESDDGLEMGVCLVEPERMRVTYSGARFDLVSATGSDIEVYKGDKSGLGYCRVPNDRRFTNHSIRLRQGQRFYMYTDGIIDQVGGNKRRAFGRKRLMRVIEDAGHKPMRKQADIIAEVFDDYQGAEVRRDDVSMIGFMPVR